MKIKQGNTDYVELVANAMQATDNILTLANNDNVKQSRSTTNKVQGPTGSSVNKCKTNKSIDPNAMLETIDQFSNKRGANATAGPDAALALLAALGDNCDYTSCDETKDSQDKATKLLENFKKCVSKNNSPIKNKHNTNNPQGESTKKLVSGRCAKPDDTDIKVVVKYAHEKLDSRHIKEKIFDKLKFNTLIAGELELVDGHCNSEEEKNARIQIAKTLCYHKNYMEDDKLREGYEAILQQVEQGKLNWSDELGIKLHEHLDYRANVNMRNKVSQQETTKTDRKQYSDRKSIEVKNNGERVIYCLDYNLGKCPHSDHHEGRFAGKKVTKFHICRRCHTEGEFKSHKDSEPACPNKKL